MPDPHPRRRSFGPVLAAGVGAGALVATAAARPWYAAPEPGSSQVPPLPGVEQAGEMPLAAAVSLVVLAGWGVVLVTRGAVRRAAAGLALLGALGLAATVVSAGLTLPDQVAATARAGAAVDASGGGWTVWLWVAAAGSVVLVVAGALAVVWSPAWPEMGSRYDAPGGTARPPVDVPPEQRSNLDLWKQLDEGRDPTA